MVEVSDASSPLWKVSSGVWCIMMMEAKHTHCLTRTDYRSMPLVIMIHRTLKMFPTAEGKRRELQPSRRGPPWKTQTLSLI